jgi:beta-lactamase regulating signal transducer with metallopeptidase domain
VTIETVLVLSPSGSRAAEARYGSRKPLQTYLTEGPNPTAWRSLSLPRAFFGAWLVGTFTVGLVQACRVARLRSSLRTGTPVSAGLVREIADLSATLRICPPAVVGIPGVKSPMVWACLRPMLVWPADLEACLPPASRRAVLLHELAHLRRRDHWVGWLELLAGCVCWWNPLFWYVRRQMRECAELACDAWVTATLPAARRDYAEALIEVSQRLPVAAVPTPAMSLGRSARHTFERRLTMILRERVPNQMTPAALAAVVLLGLVVIPAWSIAQETPEPSVAVPALGPAPQLVDVAVEVTQTPARIEATPVIVPAPAAPASAAAPAAAPAPAAPAPARVLALQAVTAPPARAGGDDAERRLRALEDHIARLQAEIKALRGGANRLTVSAPRPAGAVYAQATAPASTGQLTLQAHPSGARYTYSLSSRPGTVEVQTLNRATYKLPPAKAEALNNFLREHLSDDVDVKVQGDTLVVTASPETQSTITQFIELFQKAQPKPMLTPESEPKPALPEPEEAAPRR